MNKAQLIARVQRNMGMGSTRESARAAVNAVLNSIAEHSQKERIELRGMGSFYHQRKEAKKVKHPTTGKMCTIPAHSDLCFTASGAPSNNKLAQILKIKR